MKELISEKKNQYKANLHCHSVFSDGKLTPEELKEAYKSNGYSVLAITDHERAIDHSDLTDEEFLMLTGYEMYIRPGNRYDAFGPEIHMNLFARDPHNVGMIMYNPDVARYTPEEEKANVVCLGRNEQRMFTPGFINRAIDEAKKNGYIVTYNHPYWSHQSVEDIMKYRGFFSIEMCNYSSFVDNHVEYNAQIYDELMWNGIRIGCHSADDNHNKHPFGSKRCDSFGGMTYILSDSLSYGSIFESLENGDFYSSMGPQIFSVTVDSDKVRVRTSPAERIAMFFGGKGPQFIEAQDGGTVSEAEFTIPERASYFRINVEDANGKFADTRGYFREEW